MLIGLGLGPGDPELLTLKAIKKLEESDKVFVPGKLALELVSPYTDAEILDFPMTHDKTRLDSTICIRSPAQTGCIRADRRSELLFNIHPPEKSDTGKIS
jgi:precorrin-2 methylase